MFLFESMVLDSSEYLSIDLPALGIAISDLNAVIHFMDERFESGVRRHI
jgi:hypothetical protein